MTPDVVHITGLEHSYGRTQALRGVDLRVGAGECVALLGPNGAGKTTLVAALTGLIHQSAGSVEIDGASPQRAKTRARIGVVQQAVGFPRTLKVGELVSGWAIRMGKRSAAATPVLAEVGLAELTNRRTTKLSGGQQQRLQLALALVGDPSLLVLDEPTVGLDIEARRSFWQILAARRDRGTAVLLTTHQIEEAAAFADRVVVLLAGRIVASGHPDDLTEQLPDRSIVARTALTDRTLRDLPGVISVNHEAGRARLTAVRPETTVRALLDADPTLEDLRVEGASLEEAVMSITTSAREEVAL